MLALLFQVVCLLRSDCCPRTLGITFHHPRHRRPALSPRLTRIDLIQVRKIITLNVRTQT
jgi:hypothetical protein